MITIIYFDIPYSHNVILVLGQYHKYQRILSSLGFNTKFLGAKNDTGMEWNQNEKNANDPRTTFYWNPGFEK